MEDKAEIDMPPESLDEDQRLHISQVFEQEVVPRLKLRHARTGALCCGFAGSRYGNWLLYFRSRGPDFEITGFEYDKDASALKL